MSEMLQILKIAVPAPLRRLFDYRLPSSWDGALPKPGSRVRVPFGRNVLVGILVSTEFAQCDRTLKPFLTPACCNCCCGQHLIIVTRSGMLSHPHYPQN